MIENDIRVLEINDSIDIESESYEMDKFVQFTRNLQIGELEPLLDEEEYDEDKLQTDKYFFLSVLREMFTVFRRSGDDKLEYYKGKCEGCELNKNKIVHVFEGTTSKNQFGFIPIDQNNPNIGIHFCFGFTDKNGKKAENSYSFMYLAAKKLGEFQKRGIKS
ncbi:MAG: hypothetical protein H6567_07730 [Lewinellaceae bacterium]|nr:hypothetical protein [Lewinellaceae bacterium]